MAARTLAVLVLLLLVLAAALYFAGFPGAGGPGGASTTATPTGQSPTPGGPLETTTSQPTSPLSSTTPTVTSAPTSTTTTTAAPPAPSEGAVSVSVDGGQMVVEAWGFVDSVAFYSEEEVQSPVDYPELTVYPGEYYTTEGGFVHADYVYANRSYMWFNVSLDKIVSSLQPGGYTVVVWAGGSKVASYPATLSGSSLVLGSPTLVSQPPSVSCSGQYDDFFEAVLCSFNDTILSAVRATVYGNRSPASLASAAWMALQWLETNIVYDYGRASSGAGDYYDPLTTIRKGSGVCRDFTLLLAASLLSWGSGDALIMTLDLGGSAGHAFAAVRVNGSLYVLDQKLPVIEWGDYVEYILGGANPTATIYRVSITGGGPQVEAWLDIVVEASDSYPSDTVEPGVVSEALRLAGIAAGIEPSPLLKPLLPLGVSVTHYVPRLEEVAAPGNTPLTAFYSPVFAEQWSRLLADMIVSILEGHYSDALAAGGSFWATLTTGEEWFSSRPGTLYVYASEVPVPLVDVRVSGDLLVLEAVPAFGDEPGDYALQTYEIVNGTVRGPLSAVAPPGYLYTIPFVIADEWGISGGRLHIAFSLEELLRATTSTGGSLVLILFRNGEPVYLAPLPGD